MQELKEKKKKRRRKKGERLRVTIIRAETKAGAEAAARLAATRAGRRPAARAGLAVRSERGGDQNG